MTTAPVNPARGEVALVLGAHRVTLCLTLGALAELEGALGCHSLSALKSRLGELGSADLVEVLGILARAGSGLPDGCTLDDIRPGIAARAIAETFRAALA